jgi:hypothetical protein
VKTQFPSSRFSATLSLNRNDNSPASAHRSGAKITATNELLGHLWEETPIKERHRLWDKLLKLPKGITPQQVRWQEWISATLANVLKKDNDSVLLVKGGHHIEKSGQPSLITVVEQSKPLEGIGQSVYVKSITDDKVNARSTLVDVHTPQGLVYRRDPLATLPVVHSLVKNLQQQLPQEIALEHLKLDYNFKTVSEHGPTL